MEEIFNNITNTSIRRKSFNERLFLFSNYQELNIEIYIAAKQKQGKDCGRHKKNGETIYKQENGNPQKRNNPNGMNKSLYPERIISPGIFMILL